MDSEFDGEYYAWNGQAGDRPALRFYTRPAKSFFEPGRVLDFGSGTGYFLKRLSCHFEADGFEISSHGHNHTHLLLPSARLFSAPEELPSSAPMQASRRCTCWSIFPTMNWMPGDGRCCRAGGCFA